MFYYAKAFNSNITIWDTSSAINMDGMFYYSSRFNQRIGNWNVSRVSSMQYMFAWTSTFNRNISLWDTSNVRKMPLMFFQALSFEGIGLNNWIINDKCDIMFMFCQTPIVAGSKVIDHWTIENQNLTTNCDGVSMTTVENIPGDRY